MSGSSETGPETKACVDGKDGLGKDEELAAEDENEEEDEEDEEEEEEEALSPEALAEMCSRCGGQCCAYYTVMLDEPEDADDFDELRWFLVHEGNYIYVDEDEWHLNVVAACRFLDKDGRCAIYIHRPDVCRGHGHKEECEFTGRFDFDHMFKSIGDLEAYAEKVLSPEELAKLPRFPKGYEIPS